MIYSTFWLFIQLLKIGFDEETSQMDTKNLTQHITTLRHPSRITLGLKPLPTHALSPDASISMRAFLTESRESSVLSSVRTDGLSEQQLTRNKNKNEFLTRSKGKLVCLYVRDEHLHMWIL